VIVFPVKTDVTVMRVVMCVLEEMVLPDNVEYPILLAVRVEATNSNPVEAAIPKREEN
jgi:hypothetical protein